MRDMYAARTTGTWEWAAPASHVDVIHSIYMLVTSGTPNPPWARLACITSETLPFLWDDPRKPRVRCIHWETIPRTRSSKWPNWDAALDREQQATDEGPLDDFAHLCKGGSEGGAFAKEGANRGFEFLHLYRPPPIGVDYA